MLRILFEPVLQQQLACRICSGRGLRAVICSGILAGKEKYEETIAAGLYYWLQSDFVCR
jgi:hypothetical protein